MNIPVFYLSKDKLYLTDKMGKNVYVQVKDKDHIYYKLIGIESEGYEKMCTGNTPISVCILWNEAHECLAFAKVNICTSWALIPKGYSNIS